MDPIMCKFVDAERWGPDAYMPVHPMQEMERRLGDALDRFET